MANKFGMASDPEISKCALCGEIIEHIDKLVVEGETIHKTCFKCSLCGCKLQMGHCASDRALYGRYGPRWYCSLVCCTRPLAEKEAKLKEMGVQMRQPKKKDGSDQSKNDSSTGQKDEGAGTKTDEQKLNEKTAASDQSKDGNGTGSQGGVATGTTTGASDHSKDGNVTGVKDVASTGMTTGASDQSKNSNITGTKDDVHGSKESEQSSKNSNSSKTANKFGMAQDPDIAFCALCGDRIEHVDKLVVESETIHKTCFKCSLCGCKLQMGHCASDRALYGRYGPRWYCSLVCCTRPLQEKEAKLKEMGVQVRQPKKKE